MSTIRILKCVCCQLLFMVSISLPYPVMAEEMLYKEEAKYLGWHTGKKKFTTCSGNIIEVGTGRIEETNEKCEKTKPPLPVNTIIKGRVENINYDNRTFQIKDEKGEFRLLFFPLADEEKGKVKLKDIQIGNEVSVTTPIKGRAEAIEKK